MEVGGFDGGMVQVVEFREPDVLVVFHQRNVGDGVSDGIVGMLQNVVRAVGQRIFGGVVHIMHCRVYAADGAVENGFVAIHYAVLIAQEEQSLVAGRLQSKLISIR